MRLYCAAAGLADRKLRLRRTDRSGGAGSKRLVSIRDKRGREGKKSRGADALATFEVTRPLVGASALGIAQAAYEWTIEYLDGRTEEGMPLAQTQRVQQTMADVATEIEAARLLVQRAAWMGRNGVPMRGERVLEIGTGSGFFAASLAWLTGSVDSIEIHADLAAGAARAIAAQGISRVSIETGDALAREYAAAYEVVAVTGSLPAPEPRLERALVVGGRMFVVIGSPPIMEARLVTRTGEDYWLSEALYETRIEPLVLPAVPSRFRF